MKQPKVDHTDHEHGTTPPDINLCEHVRCEAARTAACDVYRADLRMIEVHLITPTVYLAHLLEYKIICAVEVTGPGLGDMRVTVSCLDDDDNLSRHTRLAAISYAGEREPRMKRRGPAAETDRITDHAEMTR